jgi:predicted CopG family antitoxin
MQTPVIFLIGHPGHGKTEARKALCEITHLKGESTSEVIYHVLAKRRGVSVAELKKTAKEYLRPALIEMGDFICGGPAPTEEAIDKTVDASLYRIPSALVRTLYVSGYNIIDGARRKRELSDSNAFLAWNGVRTLTIWVDRPGHPYPADNTELTREDADEVVVNDGPLIALKQELFEILEKHFGKQDEVKKPVEVVDAPVKPRE